ncbi:uncharacterized protein LOC124809013 isoform X1 [Hydra vulgaris]|uniref:uncharacterized protein LOC124809013 isoform X1 n=1 Tax=Hydra vulgaris TaxID=6087 RepID=UPI001F5EE604|nr:uncharacterized protein LOC124809013 [Hydra vulgaris]
MPTYQKEKSTRSLRIMNRRYNIPLKKTCSSAEFSSCPLTDLKTTLNLPSKAGLLITSFVCHNSNSPRKPLIDYKVSNSLIQDSFEFKDVISKNLQKQIIKEEPESLKLVSNPPLRNFKSLSDSTCLDTRKFQDNLFSEKIKNHKLLYSTQGFLLQNSCKREPNILDSSLPIKTRKVFYSDRQSGLILGIPSAPPSTPCYIVDFTSSLSDIKSQRKIQRQLKKIENQQNTKLQKTVNKIRAEEKRKEEEIFEQRKLYQRQQIYMMNQLMSELEKKQFKEFKMQQVGLPV